MESTNKTWKLVNSQFENVTVPENKIKVKLTKKEQRVHDFFVLTWYGETFKDFTVEQIEEAVQVKPYEKSNRDKKLIKEVIERCKRNNNPSEKKSLGEFKGNLSIQLSSNFKKDSVAEGMKETARLEAEK